VAETHQKRRGVANCVRYSQARRRETCAHGARVRKFIENGDFVYRKGKRATQERPRRLQTIREVARVARVGVAPVSRTLQRPQVVAETTRQRVYDTVARLGYTPNAQARTLRTARTRLVIALVPDIANPFFSEVIRGMEQIAHQNGYSVLLGDTQNSLAREQVYADMIPARQADGLITLLPHFPHLPPEWRLRLGKRARDTQGSNGTT